MNIWIFLIAAFAAIAATSFVVMAFLWLKKLRVAVTMALGETAHHHIRSVQRMNDDLAQIQKRQRALELHLHNLTKAHARLQQDFEDISSQIETMEPEEPPAMPPSSDDRTVH